MILRNKRDYVIRIFCYGLFYLIYLLYIKKKHSLIITKIDFYSRKKILFIDIRDHVGKACLRYQYERTDEKSIRNQLTKQIDKQKEIFRK